MDMQRKRRQAINQPVVFVGAIFVIFMVSACSENQATTLTWDPASDMIRVPAHVKQASRQALRSYASGAPTILFLNYDGVNIQQSGSSDASQNASFIGAGTIPPFEGDQNTKDQVTALVKQLYARYNIQIVTQRPASGNYDMAAIGGTPENIGMGSGGIIGVAPMDCNNEMPQDIAFTFAGSIKSYGGNYVQIVAETIAHETGHTYGLPHSNDGCDLMSYDTCQELKTFLDKTMGMQSDSQGECGMNSMNTNQVLLTNLGPSTGAPPPTDPPPTDPPPTNPPPTNPADTLAPQVLISSPANGASVNPSLTVSANIADNVGVVSASLDVDGLVVSSRSTPPFDFALTLTAGQHTLTVSAFDAAGNRGTGAVTVTTDANQPSTPPPTNPDPTPVPQPGQFGATCLVSSDCTSHLCAEDTVLNKKYCTQMCDPSKSDACPGGSNCFASGATYVCGVPSSTTPASPTNRMDDALLGGCSINAARGADGSLGWAWILGIALVCSRRRRRKLQVKSVDAC
jgi:hypothetical protein